MNFTFYILHSSLPRVRPQGERKAGMALIIVLGLVSLLLISSVTFAIMMRIERASSANARNTTIARQAARSTLAYAMAAINQNIGAEKWAGWQDSDRESPIWTCPSDPRLPLEQPSTSDADRRGPQFWKDTFGSIDHNIPTNEINARAIARILGNQMQHYLPHGIRHRAWAQRYDDKNTALYPPDTSDGNKLVIAPEWVPMTCGTNAVNLENVVGRCAFLAFDTSGYLDIPALCKNGDTNRTYGASAAEIQPIKDFFYKESGMDAATFKDKNKGFNFENVAEIRKASHNVKETQGNSLDNNTVFANGATFSAFNFCPPERLPPENEALFPEYVYPNFPFKNKICIAGDGSENHINSLRRHKAAIIAAFMQSGLTASSSEFSVNGSISDAPCSDGNCTVCGGKASKSFSINENDVAEQALWAYLGLIDYIDGNNEPFYDDKIGVREDIQRFARPYVENTPLFNGYVAIVKFTRSETYNEKPIPVLDSEGNPTGATKMEKIFDTDHAKYKVDVNAKVVFANRCAADSNSDAFGGTDDSIENRMTEAKLAFCFDGGDGDEIWSGFSEEAKRSGQVKSKYDGAVLVVENKREFGDGPVALRMSAEVTLDNKDSIDLAKIDDEDHKNGRFLGFPEFVRIGAAGRAYLNGKDTSRFPADSGSYEDAEGTALEEYKWLVSVFDSNNLGASFNDASDYCHSDERVLNGEEEIEVYVSEAEAQKGTSGEKYPLKRKCVNLILWGELLDPRFSCASAAETPSDPTLWPKTAFSSHIEEDQASDYAWSRCSIAKGNLPGFSHFDGANDFIEHMKDVDNEEFDDFVSAFVTDQNEFLGYFDIDGEDGLWPGYSALQRYFLSSKEALDDFHGVTDGSRRTSAASGDIDFDSLKSQFHSAYVRNGGLDTAGELGFLPIGPYATIRLFGFEDECRYCKNDVDESIDDESISMFNQVTKTRPYHRVLDYFGNSYRPVRGRISLNSCDYFAVASAFNGVPLDDYLHDSMEDTLDVSDRGFVKEDDAKETVYYALGALLDKLHDAGKAATISDLGRIYDGEYYDKPDYYNEFAQKIFDGDIANNMAREAMIRNTCGLFSSRGINMTIILRGEAFTPFFGKSTVRSEFGNTLASRYALAQVWRDTESEPGDEDKKPEERNYPFFVQYFKIFDD